MRTRHRLTRARMLVTTTVVVVAALGGVGHADPNGLCEVGGDAGGTPENATNVTSPVLCRGDLTAPDDDVDWYKIVLKAGQRVRLTVSPEPPLFASGMRFFRPDGVTVVEPPDCVDNVNQRDSCNVRVDESGAWRLEITREVGAGPYELNLVASAAQNDCGLDRDAPDTFATAIPHKLPISDLADAAGPRNVVCEGAFDSEDTIDYYGVPVFESMKIIVRATFQSSQAIGTPRLLAPDGSEAKDETPNTRRMIGLVQHVAKMPGMYVFEVPKGSAPQGTYDLKLGTVQVDCGAPRDAPSTGTGIEMRNDCKGALDARSITDNPAGIDPFDTVDRLRFRSEQGAASLVQVTMTTGQGLCARMTLTDPAGAVSSLGSVCNGAPSTFTGSVLTGYYELQLDRTTGAGMYVIDAEGIVIDQADCDEAGDASNTQAGARLIAATGTGVNKSVSCKGDLRPAGDVDWYQINVPAGAVVVTAFNEDDDPSLQACLFTPGSNACASSPAKAHDAGLWNIRVTGAGSVPYSMVVTVKTQNDCFSQRDAGESQQTAVLVSNPLNCLVPSAATGIGEWRDAVADTSDWYRIDASEVSGFVAYAEPLAAGTEVLLCIHAPFRGTPECASGRPGPGNGALVSLHACDIPPGIRIPFQPCAGGGPWYVEVTATAAAEGKAPGLYRLLVAGKD